MFSLLKRSMLIRLYRHPAKCSNLAARHHGFSPFVLDRAMMEHEATSAIQELSEEEDFKLRVIQLHYDTLKHCVPSATIPTVMTDAMLMYMLQNYGESEESRLWGFVQMKRNMERLPKVLRTPVIPDKEPAKITKGTLGPLSNTIVLFDRKRMVAHCYNEVCFNMTQRPPIVIDFTYSVAKKWNSVHGEVNDCFRDNLIRRTPHFFQLCNIPQDDEFSPMRERLMENLGPECPYLVTDKSYTDLHPKEKLIYMTNASLNILETYDPDAVYVFANSQRLASLPKDKILLDVEKRGIRTARIPGSFFRERETKRINLSRSLLLLNLFQFTSSWKKSFEIFEHLNDYHDTAAVLSKFLN